MEKIDSFFFTKILTSIAIGQIFKGIEKDGMHIKTIDVTQGLMRSVDTGHNDKTHSFQFYFEDDEDSIIFFMSVNCEKIDEGNLFLNITFNLEDKLAQAYVDTKIIQENSVTKDDKGTTRKTITYSYIFSKKSLSGEIFKNIRG